MDPIFVRVNFNRQLAENVNELDIEKLEKRFLALRKFMSEDKTNSIMNLYLAHDRIIRALYDNDGVLKPQVRKNFSREVEALSHTYDKTNRYFAYFDYLTSESVGPLTPEKLKTLYSKIENMPEIASPSLSIDEKNERRRTLLIAYSVLAELVERNGGIYENPKELRDVELKTCYAKKDDLSKLSESEKEILDRLNKAKLSSVRRFLPAILLASEKDTITTESVERRYRNLISLNIFGTNMTDDIRKEIEQVYQAIMLTLENANGVVKIEDRSRIIETYEDNIKKVENSSDIVVLLEKYQVITQKVLEDALNKLIEKTNASKGSLESYDTMIDIQLAYASILNRIKNENGKCSKGEAIDAYKSALKKVAYYRNMHSKAYNNPFQIFEKDSDITEDETYINLSKKNEEKIEDAGNRGNLEDIFSTVALQKVYRDLYEILRDPKKRREFETVDFEVNQRGRYMNIGICDLNYVRLSSPEDIVTLNNAVGDEIRVVQTGKLGFGLIRNSSGRATYSDNMTIDEYEVTKTYYSTQNGSKTPRVKTFRIFSPYIQKARLQDREFYFAYADRIFSDLSLNAAVESNGGLVAGVTYVIDKDGKEVPKIYFDQNALCACIDLERSLNEYEEVADRDFYPRRVAKRLKDGALVGQSALRVNKGYASKVMYHRNGGMPENDILVAYEWSDVQKENDVFTRIYNDNQRY